jgi:NAD(P)-dependent dehydrogenase (short-subunit alcohol dehydrogenase family)
MKVASVSARTAVVTGGTRGIGWATAECLRDSGVQVLVTGTRPDGHGPPGCEYESVDFLDADQTEQFCRRLRERSPAILVNNAGVTKPQPFASIDTAEFERVQRINLFAPQALCGAVLPGMRALAWGRIVNVSSMWGVVSKVGRATYSASKGGVDSMTRALAAEVARDGILANCVAPGFIETEMLMQATTEVERAELARQVPIGRLAKAEEVARFITWLCSDENTYISGQSLVIDGGYTTI